ncbi:RelA/SpoT domain-containing protein [Serratia marcescens]
MNNNSQLSELVNDIERCVSALGVMYRIFSREKSASSLNKKIDRDPKKYNSEKKIQDLIGIRIALYFVDDIEIVQKALKRNFDLLEKDSQVDHLSIDTFKAVRCNLVFRLKDSFDPLINYEGPHAHVIDNTFEVQIRTILSEGWHEVDHDLRFKCKDDWTGFDKENRAFNGVYASLETSEWTMLKLFEDLAYKHYKLRNIKAMFNNKFRLRMQYSDADETIMEYLSGNDEALKLVYRYERTKLFDILSARPKIPITLANLVFIMNIDGFDIHELNEITPDLIFKWWRAAR